MQNPDTATFGNFSKEGPSDEQLREGHTKLTFIGHGIHEKDSTKQCTITVELNGPDPGYTLTSTTVSQAALCLLNVLIESLRIYVSNELLL